jgi:aspartate-semialdehyde dehydrogenase
MRNKSKFRVAVVGAGLVGEELVRVLEQRQFPIEDMTIMATSRRVQKLAGKERQVIEASEDAFDDVDIALFAGTEGESGASKIYGWQAAQKGVLVIDNGNDYRMDPRVPLIVPEVNAEKIKDCEGFISNPNCSTIQLVVALAPLHKAIGIKRIVVSTYQSVSGTGREGIRALQEQRKAAQTGAKYGLGPYPHPIYDNCIPEIGGLKQQDAFPGSYSEEIKMICETRKIMDEPELPVSATCVRVPVAMCHSEAINVELKEDISIDQVRHILAEGAGVEVVDNPSQSRYPTARSAAGQDPVYVGRLRKDPGNSRCVDMWCVADNIRKGAALNAVQIAEKAIDILPHSK